MKNLLRAVMVLAVLVLAGIAALAFWVGPQVEELARREIAALPMPRPFPASCSSPRRT